MDVPWEDVLDTVRLLIRAWPRAGSFIETTSCKKARRTLDKAGTVS